LAQVLAKADRIPEAIAEMETARQLDPENDAINQQLEQLKAAVANPAGDK
jgi:hypothetical protein